MHSVKLHWLGSSFSAMLTVGPLARSSNPRSEIGSVSHYHQTYEQGIWSLDPLTPYIPSFHGIFVSLILREPIWVFWAMCGYLVMIRPYLSQEGCVLTTSLAFLIYVLPKTIRWWNFRSSTPPLDEKKSYSSHQINIINQWQTFVFGFQFYGSTNIPSLMLKMFTVVPNFRHVQSNFLPFSANDSFWLLLSRCCWSK